MFIPPTLFYLRTWLLHPVAVNSRACGPALNCCHKQVDTPWEVQQHQVRFLESKIQSPDSVGIGADS